MTQNEHMLCAKLDDAIRLSRSAPRYIGFLDPAEVAFAYDYLKHNHKVQFSFQGGYDEAERLILAIFQSGEPPADFPIVPITFRFRSQDSLSHRDFLGALMAEGVTRAVLGDILIEPGRAVVFVKTELSGYFLNGVTRVGRVGVKCVLGADAPLPSAHAFEELSGVIASARLDCLVAFWAKLSREKAVALISSGLVTVNHREMRSVSSLLSEGDRVSIRSVGKFIVDQLGPVTKKGRLALRCRKYK